MHGDIEKILYSDSEISARVQEMGDAISKDYESVYAVGILKGASIFFADLMRKITIPARFDFMTVSSYGLDSVSSGDVKIKKDLDEDIKGKDILLVEDIIDTGITMNSLKKILTERGANSVKLAAFLSKPERREVEVKIDYLGFDIEDEFVVGYGLDYAEKYRNLPYIGILKRSIYE